jgi:hypothetical protein
VSEEPLSIQVREFIARHLRSIEQLEILLLLSSEPGTIWTAQRVYDRILSRPTSVQHWLDEFVALGLFQSDGAAPAGYRYSVPSELRGTVSSLAQFYKTMPVRVIEAIYRKNTDAAQGFADAFKFKPNS